MRLSSNRLTQWLELYDLVEEGSEPKNRGWRPSDWAQPQIIDIAAEREDGVLPIREKTRD